MKQVSQEEFEDTKGVIRIRISKMRILKNSKDLLETLSSRFQFVCNSIKTFDFSTLYTTIPGTLLSFIFKELIQRCFHILLKPLLGKQVIMIFLEAWTFYVLLSFTTYYSFDLLY
jgi:hypothetical protein